MNSALRFLMAASTAFTILGAGLGTTHALAAENVDLKRPASREAAVRINNVAGSIKISGWDKDEIAVTGSIGSGVEKVDLSGEPDHAQIRVVLRKNSNDGSADLVIHVPSRSHARFEVVSASVEADNLQGTLEGESVSGPIKVSGKLTEASLKTVSGSLHLTGAADRVQLKSVSGEITAKDVGGELEVNSVSGSVDVTGREFTRASVKAVSASIRFDGAFKGDKSFDFESHSGSVELVLPATTSATFDVSTFSGSIRSEFGDWSGEKKGFGPGREARFTVGQDGARVSLKSFSGSVNVKKK